MPDLGRTHTGQSIGRTASRPSRPSSPQLSRLMSANHLDDHSVYHSNHSESQDDSLKKTASGRSDDNESSNTSEASDVSEQDHEEEDKALSGNEPVAEIRGGIPDERDVDIEKAQGEKFARRRSSRSAKDPNLVTWDGPDDPQNPKNWSFKRKWAATLIVSCFTLISPVSSSMVAPAIQTISKDFNITNEVEQQLVLSIFILAYAIGPLFLGPLSEIYGRVPVLQLANLVYLAWNLGCGFAQNKSQMLGFRFMSGLGGSAPLAIGGGLLSDLFQPEQRGRAISIYSLAPLLGPAIGPIAGGFITENTTWRWAFYATSIACGIIQFAGLFFLQETYAPKLLKQKADRLRKETGNTALHTEFEQPDRTLAKLLRTAMIRPFRLLATQPIVQVLAIYMAYLYGLMYLVLSTFPTLWTEKYGESVGIEGLNYISLGLGCFLGTQISAPINDHIYRRLKKKSGSNTGKPEFRVPLMIPASLLVPIGLFWYGWSAQAKVHWIMPNIGTCIFCAGVIVGFQCIQTYLVDSYTRFAASAVAAATVLRSLAGFGFPLFAPYMYASLDYGWGNSLLGFIAMGLGIPAPFLLWKYGPILRAKSKFAAGP